jgi:flavodoxin
MNALVLYDSKFGNTEQVARTIAAVLAEDQQVQVCAVSDIRELPPDAELLVIGGPTHAHGLSQPLKAFLASLPSESLRGRSVATFDTRYRKPRWLTGSAAVTLAKRLGQSQARLVVEPTSFFVTAAEGPLADGELARAAAWARAIAGVMPSIAARAPVG